MYIHKISNNITFGYNQKLNNIVNNKLKSEREDSELSNQILKLNKFCMSTEDSLRKAEKVQNNDLIGYYTNLLVTMKPIIVNEIEDKYPELNYREKEVACYRKEADYKNKDEYDWRYTLAEDLEIEKEIIDLYKKSNNTVDFMPIVNSDNKKEGTKAEVDQIDTNKILNKNEQTVTPEKKEDSNKAEELLEKFEPLETSPKSFDDLGGLEKLKEVFEETIIEPVMYPDMAELDKEEYGITLPRGFLLYGPPGCGKTSIVEAMSLEAGLPLYKLRIGKSGSMYINKSSNNIEIVFDYLSKQVQETGKPVILFMDEVEAIAPSRRSNNIGKEDIKMVSTLLPLIENARSKGIIVVAATNCLDIVEDAVKFRFDNQQYIGLPDKENRAKILKVHLNSRTKGRELANNAEDMEKLSKKTDGFSGRTIAILVGDAAKIARNDGRRNITESDFDEPISKHKDERIDERKYRLASANPTPIGYQIKAL